MVQGWRGSGLVQENFVQLFLETRNCLSVCAGVLFLLLDQELEKFLFCFLADFVEHCSELLVGSD